MLNTAAQMISFWECSDRASNKCGFSVTPQSPVLPIYKTFYAKMGPICEPHAANIESRMIVRISFENFLFDAQLELLLLGDIRSWPGVECSELLNIVHVLDRFNPYSAATLRIDFLELFWVTAETVAAFSRVTIDCLWLTFPSNSSATLTLRWNFSKSLQIVFLSRHFGTLNCS